jgi:hypothetical protein
MKFRKRPRHLAFLANASASKRVQGLEREFRRKQKMSRRTNFLLPILVALVLAVPLAARDVSANNSKATNATMDVLSQVILAGKILKPGSYSVSADDSKVTVTMGGKVVAEAAVQWKDETSKAKYSNIVTVGDQVKEIHFSGKMRYVEVTE